MCARYASKDESYFCIFFFFFLNCAEYLWPLRFSFNAKLTCVNNNMPNNIRLKYHRHSVARFSLAAEMVSQGFE